MNKQTHQTSKKAKKTRKTNVCAFASWRTWQHADAALHGRRVGSRCRQPTAPQFWHLTQQRPKPSLVETALRLCGCEGGVRVVDAQKTHLRAHAQSSICAGDDDSAPYKHVFGFTTPRLRYAQPRAWAAGHRVA
eukprot:362748-Chlamydomonas_euryale.AAC.1